MKIKLSFILLLLCIFCATTYAETTKKFNFNILKTFFDSLSIDEIEKQKKLASKKKQVEGDNSDSSDKEADTDDDNKSITPKETSITRYFKSWVLTGSIGPLWENAGENQTLYLAPRVKKTYTTNGNTNALTGLSLFWGVQKPLFKEVNGQIGVTLATASNAVLSGEIWDDANPKFNNLNYSYSIKATRIAAKGTLLLDKNWFVIPWISGSLGISYNNFYNFINTPKIFEVLMNPKFQDYTTQSLSYSFGAGFQKKLSTHWQIGIGYDFTDWGHGRLSKSLYQTTYNAIKLNNYYTNGILFNLSYLA